MDKDKTVYDVCVDLKRNGIEQSRKDDAFYFVTPDILVRIQDIDSLHKPDKTRDWEDLFEKLVYYPTTQDLIGYIGSDLQQIQRLSDFTLFAYVEPDTSEQEAFRGRGNSIWEALATVAMTRFEARKAALISNNPF